MYMYETKKMINLHRASQAWKLYDTLQLAMIIQKDLYHMVETIELIEGDGAVGTVLELTFVEGQGITLNSNFLFY